MRPLILASISPYRRALLERFGLPFTCIAPGVPEMHLGGESPPERARRLARQKAQAVLERQPNAVVIGSDQVAAAEGVILDKPGSVERCTVQLTQLSAQNARFYTACAVLDSEAAREHLDTTGVQFRTLHAQEIARYVAQEAAFDCAGGFKAEGLGVTLFERIDSTDPTALIGLPLIWLAGALRAAGYPLP